MAEIRVSTILPTIKCSNCTVDIPISQLGDHVCSKAPAAPAARLDILDNPFLPRKKSPLGLSASRQPPPRLENVGSSNSISSIRLPFSSTSSGESSPRTASPVPSLSGRRSPYLAPPRSLTSPLPSRPPSEDVTLPQDSAFPTFPTTRSRSTTPTSPINTKPSLSRTQTEPVRLQDKELNQSAKATSTAEASKMLQNLDGLSSSRTSARREVGEGLALKGHKKSPSMGSSKDFSSRPTSAATLKSHNRMTSASSSVYTRVRSVSTVSSTSRYDWDAPDVPAVPAQLKTPDLALQDSPTLPHDGQAKGFDFGLPQSSEPQIIHQDANKVPERAPSPERRQPEPSPYTHKPRSSVTAAMAPLNSIGSSSSFKPSRSIRGRKASVATNRPLPLGESGSKTLSQDTPPVPAAFQRANSEMQTSNHTPNESTSSNGSYSSGVRTGSSRSSPPLQESPQKQKAPDFSDVRSDNPFSGFQFDVDRKSPVQEAMPALANQPPSPEREQKPTTPFDQSRERRHYHNPPPEKQISPVPPFEELGQCQPTHGPPTERQKPPAPPFEESRTYAPPFKSHVDRQGLRHPSRAPSLSTEPTLPEIEPTQPPNQQNSPQTTSPDDYMISHDSHDHSNQFHFTPALSRPPLPSVSSGPPPPQRFRPPDKGVCRGCNEPIRGKSVSSADGRLTGRYHKGCFVCTTCGNPFLTADFYVLRNHPYCARHYHELNNSMCNGCNRGIEGQYLETETHRKFHSYCFTCQDCHKILKDDYFEWKGRTLCEQHAFRAAQMPSSGLGYGAGRRFPERRTTKLMMM